MLSSLLQKRSIFYLYRLAKPNISQFKSIEELEYDQKQRELELIESINLQRLNQNKLFTRQKFISSTLNLSQELSEAINKRQFKFSAISPTSLKHHTLQQNINDAKIDYPFLLEEIQVNLPDLNAIPKHYSYKRSIPIINEYELDKKTAYVFNLPQQFNVKEISQKLGLQTVKNIKIQYCRLGLPAYAKVSFNSDDAITNLVLNNKNHIELGGRICFIKTYFDKEKLQLKNRRLVIQNLEQNQDDLLLQLSQYGRIIHFDYPTFISRNPSLQQIKQTYKNSETLIKINYHRKNGQIDSEFYPSVQETYKTITTNTPQDFQAAMIQKRQRQEAMYKSRMRYAHQIDAYEGKQNDITIKNLGFCIVTYSCLEQAQNTYFNLRLSNKVKLFNSSSQQEFQVDEQYRKRILRFVDGQYRKNQALQGSNRNDLDKQIQQQFDELPLLEKLADLEYEQEQMLNPSKVAETDDDPQQIIAYFKVRSDQIKRDLVTKLGSRSFDQLAEIELFGRILPKRDPKKPKISLQIMPQVDPELKEAMKEENLQNITVQSIKQKEQAYALVKKRETRKANFEKAQKAGENGEQGQGDAQEGQQTAVDVDVQGDQQYKGKHGFSTIKKRTVAFRARTPLQHANYILRYCEYVKNIIQQYQGVFSESRLKISMPSTPTFLNPQSLQFSDGTNYINEDDLPKFLQCMRNLNEAQKIYTQFWKDLQIFKSRSIDVVEYINQVRSKQFEAINKYVERGVVKEVFQLEEGQDIQEKVKYLNATVAAFGQEFRAHQGQNGKIIVKIAKIDLICPLDKMTKISNYLAKHPKDQKKQKIFNKYKHEMIETGEIPEQIRKQFNIPAQKTLDNLFSQLASEAGIYKKDIQVLLNMQNFSEEQIKQDVGLQIQLEKVRLLQRESKASDYAKDPSNIQIRDKEGFFRVSKFRQI